MRIELNSVSKRFAFEWIFKDIKLTIEQGERIAIIGPNGSGKSTLLRVLMGALEPSNGKILFQDKAGKALDPNQVHKNLSFTAPYMDIPMDLTLDEMVRFHFTFKKPLDGINPSDIAQIAYLEKSKHKLLSHYSSGMLQRLKLSLAILSSSELLILDEATTNLDVDAKKWFRNMLNKHLAGRSLILATNEIEDLDLCDRQFNVQDYK